MIKLAKKGIIPRNIQKIKKVPPCAACIFARAHKGAWRTPYKKVRQITLERDQRPGTGTSCDHIISKQPGLLPQLTGHLTHKRYGGAAVFVNHFSQYCHIHLMISTSDEKTMNAKWAYERALKNFGHRVHSYHADNSRFN